MFVYFKHDLHYKLISSSYNQLTVWDKCELAEITILHSHSKEK